MPNRIEENNRLTNREQHLIGIRHKPNCDISRYTADFPLAEEYVKEILQTQEILIVRQFRKQPCWMSLMFWEGLSPGEPVKEEMLPEEVALLACVDALQISLTLFRLLTLTIRLSKDKWLWKGNRILHMDCGEEEEAVLQGCVAGIGDYIAVVGCQEMRKIKSVNIRRRILEQYGVAVNRLCLEQDILRKGPLDEERLQQLREVWRNDQSMSAYRLGTVCANDDADCSINANLDAHLKEFEFWKSLQWLHSRRRGQDENLLCASSYVDKRLTALMESDDLTKELRQLLQFCSNNC